MCINNYRWPFEKYRLQKIYFGVYTTAQKNVTCLNVRDPKFFFFSEVGKRMTLLVVCVDPQLGGHLAAQQRETVCDHSSKTSCPVSLWVIFFFTQPSGSRAASLGNVGSHGGKVEEAGRESVSMGQYIVGCYHHGAQWAGAGLLQVCFSPIPRDGMLDSGQGFRVQRALGLSTSQGWFPFLRR